MVNFPDPPRDLYTMWCGFDQLTWRSHPGNRQPLSRTHNARMVGADTVGVALPTSITIESGCQVHLYETPLQNHPNLVFFPALTYSPHPSPGLKPEPPPHPAPGWRPAR